MTKSANIETKRNRAPSKRKNRVSFMLNDEEMKALNRYIDKYKVQNKSQFMRKTLITTILQRLEEDAPTLF